MSKRKNQARRNQSQSPEEQEDVFVANVLEATNWIERNRQMVILGSIGLVLLVLGGMYYVNFQRTLRQSAVNQLENIQQTVSIQAIEDAKVQLGTFLDRYEGTPEAAEGVVLLARLHLESGDAPVAINVLETRAPAANSPIGVQAHMLLARAYEQEGRWEDAERQYLRVADAAELDFQIVEGLENAARVRVRLQNPSGAADLYGRILDTIEPTDPSRGVYEMRRAEMQELAS